MATIVSTLYAVLTLSPWTRKNRAARLLDMSPVSSEWLADQRRAR